MAKWGYLAQALAFRERAALPFVLSGNSDRVGAERKDNSEATYAALRDLQAQHNAHALWTGVAENRRRAIIAEADAASIADNASASSGLGLLTRIVGTLMLAFLFLGWIPLLVFVLLQRLWPSQTNTHVIPAFGYVTEAIGLLVIVWFGLMILSKTALGQD